MMQGNLLGLLTFALFAIALAGCARERSQPYLDRDGGRHFTDREVFGGFED